MKPNVLPRRIKIQLHLRLEKNNIFACDFIKDSAFVVARMHSLYKGSSMIRRRDVDTFLNPGVAWQVV